MKDFFDIQRFGDIYGTEGNDDISNSTSNIAIYAKGGNDSIYNKGNTVTIDGGEGNDLIFNMSNYTTINGGAGKDYIYNVGDSVTIGGGAGDDSIVLDNISENNLIIYKQGDGNDTIKGISADATIKIVGAEYEKVTTSSSSDVTLKVGNGSMIVEGSANVDFTIDGTLASGGNDSKLITGTSGDDSIFNIVEGATINALAGKTVLQTLATM